MHLWNNFPKQASEMSSTYLPVPLPIPASMFNRAYKAGNASLGAATKEYLSIPRIAALLAIASVLYAWPKPVKVLATKQGGAGVVQTKYGKPGFEMFVDRHQNTLFKDQSLGAGLGRPQILPDPGQVNAKLTNDFVLEQMRAPGVQLVAHAVEGGRGEDYYENYDTAFAVEEKA